MSNNDHRGTRPDETTPAAQAPAGQGGPLAPADGPGTQVEPAAYAATARIEPVKVRPGGPGPGAGGPGQPGGYDPRRKKTVPRGLFWVVLTLLMMSLLAIAGLVVLKPFKAAPSGALATIPPTPASSSPASSASASPSGGGSAGAGGAGSPSAGPSPSSTATAAPATSGTNLFNLTPLQNTGAYNLVNGSEEIGTTTYPDSVRFTCTTGTNTDHTYLVYDVAGFRFLNALIGVPSNATNAAGNTMSVTFFKDGTTQQLGKTLTVALDQPVQLHLSLDGASQLEIGCAATSTASQQAQQMDVALGNAVLAS
jgi:hypothetical protein